jgi:hypothetical protein
MTNLLSGKIHILYYSTLDKDLHHLSLTLNLELRYYCIYLQGAIAYKSRMN